MPNPNVFQIIATPVDANGIPLEGEETFIVGQSLFCGEGIFVDNPISIETSYLNPDINYAFTSKAIDQVTDEVTFSNTQSPIDIMFMCFTDGTRILTSQGEVAVEDLRVGDMVLTMHGTPSMQPVLWIGRTRVSVAGHPDRRAVAPILISAGALAAGVPHRNLRVSPEHALYLDGHLVPARLLVNGTTIIQETWQKEVTYWHVELPAHGLLLSDGAVSESYFDDGNRQNFDNHAIVALVKDFESHRANGTYRENACAPLVDDRSPTLTRLRMRIEDRAGSVQGEAQRAS